MSINDTQKLIADIQKSFDERWDEWMNGLKDMYCVRITKDDIEQNVKALVTDYYNRRHPQAHISNDDVAIVWRCYILGNWKVLATTTVDDGMYYEITYYYGEEDGNANHIYFDAYKRWENIDYRVELDHLGYFANPRIQDCVIHSD